MSYQFIFLEITNLASQEQKVNVWQSSILYKTYSFVKYSNFGLDGSYVFTMTQTNVAGKCTVLGSVTVIQENSMITQHLNLKFLYMRVCCTMLQQLIHTLKTRAKEHKKKQQGNKCISRGSKRIYKLPYLRYSHPVFTFPNQNVSQ